MGNGTHILAISQASTIPKHTHVHDVRWWHLLAATIFQGLIWVPARLLLGFFLRPEVRGREHLEAAHREKTKEDTGILLVANHSNALDFVFPFLDITPISMLFPLFFIARKGETYRKSPYLGTWKYFLSDTLLHIAGAHPHYPGSGDYEKSLPRHTQLLYSGATVCIFPEGKIKRLQRHYRVHGGAGYLAEKTGAVIVPVHISGVENMTAQEFFTRKRRAVVSYGSPMHSEDVIVESESVPERYQNAAARIVDRAYTLG